MFAKKLTALSEFLYKEKLYGAAKQVKEIIAFWPSLISKKLINTEVLV